MNRVQLPLQTFPSSIALPDDRYPGVFVFGANRRGVHGRGAALTAARQCGYPHGVHDTLVCTAQGCAYGVSVKETWRHTGDLGLMRQSIDLLHKAIWRNQAMVFNITALGTGLGGLHFADVAPLLQDIAISCANVRWDARWSPYLSH